MGDEVASALIKWHPFQVCTLPVSGVSSHQPSLHEQLAYPEYGFVNPHLNAAPISFRYRAARFDED